MLATLSVPNLVITIIVVGAIVAAIVLWIRSIRRKR